MEIEKEREKAEHLGWFEPLTSWLEGAKLNSEQQPLPIKQMVQSKVTCIRNYEYIFNILIHFRLYAMF